MAMLRRRKAVILLLVVCALLWGYRYGNVGRFEVAAGAGTVSRLVFPERTFRYTGPFFFQSGRPASLFVASVPPGALRPGDKVWRIVPAGAGVGILEGSTGGFEPRGNDLDMVSGDAAAPCAAGADKDLGGAEIASSGLRIQMSFRGVHFRKPVFTLFSMEGAAGGFRMADVYFGHRVIDVCRGSAVAAEISQRVWNVPSEVRLPDMAWLSMEHGLLFVTGDAARSDAILAVRYGAKE